MDQQKHLEDLSEIRSIMERSTRFLSLSGLSGVVVGIIALIGAGIAYYFLLNDVSRVYFETPFNIRGKLTIHTIWFILLDAAVVLFSAILTATWFTWRKAKRDGAQLFNNAALRVLINMMIPLTTGGLLCLILLWHGILFLIAPLTLLFYGMALVNASKYTMPEIRWMGITEIIIGLLSAIIVGEALLFWALGFGVAHIVYGLMMWYRYERNPR